VLASRSREPGKNAARVRYRALAKGRREQKFEELKTITLAGGGWSDCPSDPRAPFLPELREGWGAFAPLDAVIGDCGSGVMPGRTWIIAPDEVSLKQRWKRLVEEPKADKRAMLFQPHMRDGKPGDRHIGKSGKALWWPQREVLTAVEDAPKQVDHEDQKLRLLARRALAGEAPVRYGFRSFDRQYILPDARVINQPNPGLWDNYSEQQILLTAPMDRTPKNGPGLSAVAAIPDLHHYAGRGGRVFALWRNAAATESNISPAVIALLSKAFGAPVDPVDIFAYVAALLAHPAYTASFAEDLVRPGLRVPLTADAALFAEAAKLGREVIRLHTFGERFATEDPPRPPRVGEGGPTQPKDGAIPSTPEGFPDTLEYDAAKRRLLVGTGFIDNVPPAVWAYEVSGKQVLRQWFSYRRKNRERPLIGDKRPPSPLGDIQPDRWLPEYTSELINVLNVLALLVELEPKQADLLKRVCDGPLIPASKLTA
ncbi:type ISP restriction/modification enzyme, partial [Hyphomonas sp.]